MLLALRRLCLVALCLALSWPLAAQRLTVTDGSTPMPDTEIFIFSGGSKSSAGRTGADGSLGFDPAFLRQKNVEMGTRVNAYALTCQDGRIRQVVLVPDGVNASQTDIGCGDRNNLQAGQACTCQRIGAFVIGQNMQLSLRSSSGGLMTTRNVAIGGGIAAGVVTGILVAGGDDAGTGNGTSSFSLTSFNGRYSGTFMQTSTTCNPPAFVSQFQGSVDMTLTSSGATTAVLNESIMRNYTGTLTRTGGTLTGSGTFPSGTGWTGNLNVTLNENPLRASFVETITNVTRACLAVFQLPNVSKP